LVLFFKKELLPCLPLLRAHEMPIGLRLRLVPILVTAALAVAMPYLAFFCALFASRLLHFGSPHGPMLWYLYLHHAFQLLFGLIGIAVVKKYVPADYGLHMPPGPTYFGAALLWGVAFGVIMTLSDYAPNLLAHTTPTLDYKLTTTNVVGWLGFEGIFVGPSEEVPFRALLVTYLAATMPGRLRLGRFEMNWAGIIVAIMFALLHSTNFATRPFAEALGQQLYAFALGVLYAYWLEKSRSIVAPIIGHNAGDVTEYAILFAWVGFAG
jgi:membrane protease YdiL (CAAX protease family)